MADVKYAKEWLSYAQDDYDFAVGAQQHFWPKHMAKICYHCQQATEKALKAVIAYNEAVIPKTHNIERLVEECANLNFNVHIDEITASKMTDFATISRYPDEDAECTESDVKIALKCAKSVLENVTEYIEQSNE